MALRSLGRDFDIKVMTEETDQTLGQGDGALFALKVMKRPAVLDRLFRIGAKYKIRGTTRAKVFFDAVGPTYQIFLKEGNEADLFYAVYAGDEGGLALAAFLAARKLRKPFILSPYVHLISIYERALMRYLYRNADWIVARTNFEKQWLARFTSLENISVIGTAPDLPEASPLMDFKARHGIKGPYVLFLGRKWRYKGVALLLQAVPLVWERFPDCHFVFLGQETPESKQIFKNYSDPRIINLPFVDQAEKISALAGCDLLCLPSEQESFGIVFLEAWSFKKPVIGLKLEAVCEVIDDGKDGILVHRDVEELAGAITKLLADTALRRRMGEEGFQKVQTKFSMQRKMSQFREVIEILLKQPRKEKKVDVPGLWKALLWR